MVEILPLGADEVAAYLKSGTELPHMRWHAVEQHLRSPGDTALNRALSTPLMVWLAGVVYRRRGTDPGELLNAPWATRREGIEQHLLNQAIPAAFATPRGSHPARTPGEIEQVQRYLSNLANHMQTMRTYDLAWWQFVRPLLFRQRLASRRAAHGNRGRSGRLPTVKACRLGRLLAGLLLGLSFVMLVLWHGKPRRLNRLHLHLPLSRFPVLVTVMAVIAAAALGIASGPALVFGLGLTVGLALLRGPPQHTRSHTGPSAP